MYISEIFIYCFVCGVTLASDELKVRELLNRIVRDNISAECTSSILKVERYFSAYDSIPKQREYFYSSFGVGKTDELVTDDRILHRMLKCLKSAGDKEYSKSEYPLSYCYSRSPESQNILSYSVCIPSPCQNDNLKFLREWEEEMSPRGNRSFSDSSTCVPSRRETQWYRKTAPVAAIAYILASLLVCSFATIYHVQRGTHTNSLLMKIFLAFSAKTNLKRLCQMPKDRSSTITCMFGIRFITIIWIVIGHSFAWVEPFIDNIDEFKRDIAESFYNQWISNFLLTVDTFLVLGGTVNAYGWFRKIEHMEHKPGWSSFGYWLRFYRHRIVRLWPAYAYTIVGVLFLSNIHFHATWPEVDPAVKCPKYWWQNMLLVNSLFDNHCMGWTWYISTEFIFYIISPIFLLSLLKFKRFGVLISIAAIVLSATLRAVAMVKFNLPPTQLGWNSPPIFNANFMKHFSQMYIKPQYRIGPYIVGLLLGYYLADYQKKPRQYPASFFLLGWASSTVIGLLSVYGLYPVLRGWNWPAYYLLYGAIHRTTFALSIAWVVLACHTGGGSLVNRFLSFSFFLPLSSLCYSVYLSHMPVIFATFYQFPFPYTYSGVLPMVGLCFLRLIGAYVLGLQCSLLSELPAIQIENIFLNKSSKQHRITRMALSDGCLSVANSGCSS